MSAAAAAGVEHFEPGDIAQQPERFRTLVKCVVGVVLRVVAIDAREAVVIVLLGHDGRRLED
jgi:hypothetical protein